MASGARPLAAVRLRVDRSPELERIIAKCLETTQTTSTCALRRRPSTVRPLADEIRKRQKGRCRSKRQHNRLKDNDHQAAANKRWMHVSTDSQVVQNGKDHEDIGEQEYQKQKPGQANAKITSHNAAQRGVQERDRRQQHQTAMRLRGSPPGERYRDKDAEQYGASERDAEKPGARVDPKGSDITAQRINGGHHSNDDQGRRQETSHDSQSFVKLDPV